MEATPRSDSAQLALFGEFRLADASGAEIAIANRRARALLAMLALEPDRPLSREQIIKLLWPGRFAAQARASLRQTLLELGKALEPLGQPVLSVTREHVGLVAGSVCTDLGDLEQALAQGRPEAAITALDEMSHRPLLDQMSFGDPFSQWLSTGRDAVTTRLQRALEQSDAAAPLARAIAAPDTMAAKTRIAVLPFQAPGHKEGADYFADGMVDELITTLGQVPQLLVAGRTSSFHFRDSDLPPARIAEALGVGHLVEGSVQRQGDQVRIHVHLIAGDNGFELWGGRFDGTLDDVFALQENVAQAVTAAIGNALGIVMRPPKIKGLTQNKQAYDLFLQGRALCAKRFGVGVLDTAISMFEQALVFDPDFAECWVALAEAHQLVAAYTQCLDRNGAAAKMAECARRAIALAPHLGYPYAQLGIYELTRNNFVGALDYGYQAYALDPNDPAVAMRLGYFLIFIGRTRDAAPYVRAAVDQDPADGRKHGLLWGIEFCTGDLEAASATAQRMVDLGMMSISLGVTSAALGKHDLAIEQYRLTQKLMNDIIESPVGIGVQTPEAMDAYWLIAAKGICSGKMEDRQLYWQVLEMLHAALHDKSDLALVGPAIFTGNAELVFKTIGHSITLSNLMALLPLWADVDPIRQVWQHPEFIPFAQAIGMAAAWDKYGWPDLLPPPSNRPDDHNPVPAEKNLK